jgi:hypothetical protein
MPDHTRTPGISREHRISDEGLQRLERQLQRGGQISDAVLAQWIRRYGDAAREIIARHGRTSGEEQDPG